MKIGFISGVFDGFHDGHKFILKECLKHCDKLWVAVNEDDYICRNKNREPIDNIFERFAKIHKFLGKENIEGLSVVEGDSPIGWIKIVKPDIIFCGDDYTVEQVVGHELAEVKLIKRIPGISTTEIYEAKH